MYLYKLSEILGKKRVRVKQLSKNTGIGYTTLLALYHNRKANITVKTMDKILKNLNCSIDDIIEFRFDK